MKEAYDLINRYGQSGERAKKLINVIKQEHKNFTVLTEFLVNPLLVSLLYKTYEYKEELPYRKIEFYRQVYEALFNDHDKSKDAYVRPKKCGLAIREFECVLRYLAFFSMQKWCLEYESVQNLLVDVKESIDIATGINGVKPEDYVHDLLHAVPIFQKDGGAYRWTHKSFMEYFAAQCICIEMDTNIKEKLLKKMSSCEKGAKYYNILDFYYDMDLKGVRKYVLKPFLEEYIVAHDELKVEVEKKGFTISDELLDIAASAEFFLQYKIIYTGKYKISEKIEEDEAMQLLECAAGEFGPGNINMTMSGCGGVIWHTLIKQNIYLPRLCEEKYINITRKISREYFSEKDIEWIAEAAGEKGYFDDLFVFLRKGLDDNKIKKLYDFFDSHHSVRQKIYCLDGIKCKEMLQQINKDIAIEEKMNVDRFIHLE